MRGFVGLVIAMSTLLGSLDAIAKPRQEVKPNSSQPEPLQQSVICERLRVVLTNGKKIKADSYRHQEGRVEITWKSKSQTILDKDIKRVEVSQGSCPDAVVTLKTGARIEGYWRGQTCDSLCNCSAEVMQNRRALTIPASDIKKVDFKYHRTLAEKLTEVAVIPLYPVYALVFLIACRHGCN